MDNSEQEASLMTTGESNQLSWFDALQYRVLDNPTVSAVMRRILAFWMELPTGRYKVQRIDNLRVPSTDGVELATDHYEPIGAGRGPTVLMRTPYSKGSAGSLVAGLFAWQFATHGYHVVCQDCRGRFDSTGVFEPFLHEAEDGRATLDWIAQQPWSDGNVGMWGASYLGFCQWAAASTNPPNLKALAPLITSSNLMRFPENGFPLDLLLRWMFQLQTMDDPGLGMRERMQRINDGPVQDRYLSDAFMHLPLATADLVAIGQPSPLYQEMAEADASHPRWNAANYTASVATAPPADFTSGWYDLFLDGLLADYAAQQVAGRKPFLTIGPWYHLSMGYLPVAFNDGLAWFDAYLKGNLSRLRKAPVRLFVMGSNRWRNFDRWPPAAEQRKLYLQGNGAAKTGRLRWDPPREGPASDCYRYDPANPTPNIGGPKMGSDAGQVDNRILEERSDVLVFSSIPLAGDLEIIGPVRAELYVRSDQPVADFFVRLCDVEPKGPSLNVCDGNFRLTAGRGELQPDGSTRITVEMSSTAYCFKKGHRVRVQVSGGAHPRFARNLGVEEPQTLSTTFVVAEQIVYHDPTHPASVTLPVVLEVVKAAPKAAAGRNDSLAASFRASHTIDHVRRTGHKFNASPNSTWPVRRTLIPARARLHYGGQRTFDPVMSSATLGLPSPGIHNDCSSPPGNAASSATPAPSGAQGSYHILSVIVNDSLESGVSAPLVASIRLSVYGCASRDRSTDSVLAETSALIPVAST